MQTRMQPKYVHCGDFKVSREYHLNDHLTSQAAAHAADAQRLEEHARDVPSLKQALSELTASSQADRR